MLIPANDILGKETSRYTLVTIVAKRARQISNGSAPKIEMDSENEKSISIALEEVKEGKIDYVTPTVE